MYTEIECPNCKAIAKAEDILPKERQASCYNCGQTFDVGRELDIRIRRKYKIYQPDAVTMLKTSSMLELDFPMIQLPKGCAFWPIFGGIAGVLTLILLILSYFQIGIFEMVFRFGTDWYVLLFFIVAILLISFSIANQFRNIQQVARIDIKAEKEKLTVTHIDKNQKRNSDEAPKRSTRELDPGDIQQYYVVERYSNGFFAYGLFALQKDQMEVEIIPLIKDLQIALFAEQELEAFYGIRDDEVEGEVKA
jgi:hypothetical protein